MSIFQRLCLAVILSLFFIQCNKDSSNSSSVKETLPKLSTLTLDFIEKRADGPAAVFEVLSSGGANVIQKGVVWGVSPGVTISSENKIISQSGDSSVRENIRGLAINKVYYVRAFATNSQGTLYSNEVSFKIPVDINWRDSTGLYIFYIFKGGELGYVTGEIHGLMTLGQPAIPSGFFSCTNSKLLGTSTEIGSGKSNTEKLINAGVDCNDPYSWSPSIIYSLAKGCKDLNTKKLVGYSDWFIPSKDELAKLKEFNLAYKVFPSIDSWDYWTSSELDANQAYSAKYNGTFAQITKTSRQQSIPVRSF